MVSNRWNTRVLHKHYIYKHSYCTLHKPLQDTWNRLISIAVTVQLFNVYTFHIYMFTLSSKTTHQIDWCFVFPFHEYILWSTLCVDTVGLLVLPYRVRQQHQIYAKIYSYISILYIYLLRLNDCNRAGQVRDDRVSGPNRMMMMMGFAVFGVYVFVMVNHKDHSPVIVCMLYLQLRLT